MGSEMCIRDRRKPVVGVWIVKSPGKTNISLHSRSGSFRLLPVDSVNSAAADLGGDPIVSNSREMYGRFGILFPPLATLTVTETL